MVKHLLRGLAATVGVVTLGALLIGALTSTRSFAAATTSGVILGPGPNVPETYHYTFVGAGTSTPLNGGTNNVARATTNTYNLVFDARNWKDFILQVQYTLNAAGTSNTPIAIQHSADNTNWFTDATITIANNGTNTVAGALAVSNSIWGYYRIQTVGNSQASADITNLAAQMFKHPLVYGSAFPSIAR